MALSIQYGAIKEHTDMLVVINLEKCPKNIHNLE